MNLYMNHTILILHLSCEAETERCYPSAANYVPSQYPIHHLSSDRA